MEKPTTQPAYINWSFDPDIPTDDFFDGRSLDDTRNLQEAVQNFIFMLEQGEFMTWEAVVCEEQGLPLTAQQKKALGNLLCFNEEVPVDIQVGVTLRHDRHPVSDVPR